MLKETKQLFEKFNENVELAKTLSFSVAGLKTKTEAHYFLSVIFTNIVCRSISLQRIVPKDKEDFWDYTTVCSITRTLIESYFRLYDLSVFKDEDELRCKVLSFQLYDCKRRMKLFEEDGFLDDEKILEEELKNNTFFNSLSISQQNKILKGSTSYTRNLNEIALESNLFPNEESYKYFWQIFSELSHASPFSFIRNGKDKGVGLHTEMEEGHIFMALSQSIFVLEKSSELMKEFFPEYIEKIAALAGYGSINDYILKNKRNMKNIRNRENRKKRKKSKNAKR
tara:strand:+ start:167 stop:1015 length:849 start_codon:yes stop_codon:yes gene_type:complete